MWRTDAVDPVDLGGPFEVVMRSKVREKTVKNYRKLKLGMKLGGVNLTFGRRKAIISGFQNHGHGMAVDPPKALLKVAKINCNFGDRTKKQI